MVRSFLTRKSSSISASPAYLTQAEKRLLTFCRNNAVSEPETTKWNKKAVQCLLKTLKNNKPSIEELERAVAHQCSATKCIRMPKTYDNRLLVSHRRGLPHVIFCRIWRWPDLQSHHQLNAISNCECTKASKIKEEKDPQVVCVNPYHYERKKPDPVPPVVVPLSGLIPPDLSTSFEDSNSTGHRTVSDRSALPPPLTGPQVRQLLDEHDHLVAGLPSPSTQTQKSTQNQTSPRASSSVVSSLALSSGIASGSVHTTSGNAHQATSIGKASNSLSSEMGQRHRKLKHRAGDAQRQQQPLPPLPPRTRPDSLNSSSSSPLTQEDLIAWTPRRERSSLVHPAADDDEYDALFNRTHASSLNLEEVFPPPVVASPRVTGEISRAAHSMQQLQPSQEQPHRRPAGIHSRSSYPSGEHKRQALYKPTESTVGSDADNEYSGDADINAALKVGQKQQSYQKQSVKERPAEELACVQDRSTQSQECMSEMLRNPQEAVCERRRHKPKTHQSSPRIQEGKMPQARSSNSRPESAVPPPAKQIIPEDCSLVAQMLTGMRLVGDNELADEEEQTKFVKFGDTYQAINYTYEKTTPFRFNRGSIEEKSRLSRSKERSRHANMSSQLSMSTSSPQAPSTPSQPALSTASMSFEIVAAQAPEKVAAEKKLEEVSSSIAPKQVQATTSQELKTGISPLKASLLKVSTATQTQGPFEHLTERNITEFTEEITQEISSIARVSGSSGKQGPRPPHPQWAPGDMKLKDKFILGEPQPAPSPCPPYERPRPGQDLFTFRSSLFVGAQQVPFVQVLKWCTITYLEHGSSFAEEFTAKSFVVTIDGSSNMPLSGHWSLGNIPGFQHNKLCTFIRRRIGSGVKLTYVDGDVYVENLNNSESLFVSSPVMSFNPGEHTVKEKVLRVPTKSSVKVFSTALFASIINQGLPRGYEYMCYLQSFCTLRISFVKGWGKGYKRIDFSEAPCGLTVELNGHLDWVSRLTDLVSHMRKYK